jgi:two-component system sensor histidine kinase YesM
VVSIRRRFNIAFLLLVFLPGLVVLVVLSRMYLSALVSTVSRQTEAVVDQVAQNIRGEADEVSILASALFHDLELRSQADLYSRSRSSGDRLRAANRLDDKLVSFFSYSNRIGAVILYMRKDGIYYYTNYPNIRSVSGIDRSVYAEAKKNPGKVLLIDSLTGVAGNIGEKFMLSVAVCTSPQDYDTELDAVLVMFRVPYFDRLVSRPVSESGGDVVIFGRDGHPLLSSIPASDGESLSALASLLAAGGKEEGSAAFRQVRAGGRSWMASSLLMESTGWTIALLADRAAIMGSITSYRWYIYPALALLTVLFIVYAGIFLSRIANPIREVTRSMHLVGGGNYGVRVPSAAGIEELAVLTESFNRMVEEIRTLTLERERRDRERMKSELEALRFQINPHFVSNTLNSIRLMARAAKAHAIGDMTHALMRVLADSYASAGPMAELAAELSNVESYVGIMKVRFGEHFDVEYDVEERTRGLLVLRMILQPIVENAILHGISAAGRRGTIRISARLEEAPGAAPLALPEPGLVAAKDRRLVLEVKDDGVGIEAEKVLSALEEPSENSEKGSRLHHIGLANVRRRIRLNFGESFGLEVESERGRYTLVRFHLPVVRREGNGGA